MAPAPGLVRNSAGRERGLQRPDGAVSCLLAALLPVLCREALVLLKEPPPQSEHDRRRQAGYGKKDPDESAPRHRHCKL